MRINQDLGWKFYLGGESPFFDVSGEGMDVDLPHDFSIMQKRSPAGRGGPSNAYFPGGMGCYRKKIRIPEEWRGKEILLEFEGVYMSAEIHWNGQLAGRHVYGYTGFFCDVTAYVQYGSENFLSVNVNNDALPNSRWYSGSGIYRHVWLTVREPVHFACWGIAVVTPAVSAADSVIRVETEVENNGPRAEKLTLRASLLDAQGKMPADASSVFQLEPGGRRTIVQQMRVPSPRLWSLEDPYLYHLKSTLAGEEATVDTADTPCGIRSLSFDVQHGFQLNGKSLKLRGGCVHHDCGILGAASYDWAETRKVRLLRENGFNAVRCAHNPPSPAFLDACDRLGVLVIDEAFDCWHESKNPNDFGAWFDTWWKQELAAMIRRDRNHPSVIMWSTGNEILERDGRSDGYRLARELADTVRAMDSSRAVTNALCPIPRVNDRVDPESLTAYGDAWGEKTAAFAQPLDVVGYNYLRHRYAYDGKKYPERVICGTETYPSQALEYWDEVERNPQVIGDFVLLSV